MLTRADVERITENVLSELSIHVRNGDFTSPNTRVIELKLGDKVISTDYFDVVQTREYDD
jgi:hypothetical protein